ncbi:MAG: sigma-70 family RNA polymerase sigma factor [Planctomycetaceae bacterium]
MSVPLTSADLSQSDAGGALGGWGQEGSTTSPVPRTHSPESPPAEAAASESPPPVEPLSDAELLAAFVQRRDADAFTEIVQRYRHLVYRVALRTVEDRHLADDVFQATFLVLAQSAHKIKSGDVLAAWLHGTARNIARRALGNQYAEQKQLKDWAKQTLAQKGEEMATSTEPDPFEELARRHEQQLLDEELQQLPEASRAPLVLFYLEKKTQAEIAQIMGLSVEAVEGRLKRAKQELRTRLIRRGVLLSTVVAAATVLTPSITFAAPAASLVSATVTTALGTAALGSTALGATAVTGAATSSKLAAGSASASTLAAQEIAIMSATSKATAMLITTAASTTLISGLVLGAMVGTFSMGEGSVSSESQSVNLLTFPGGVISELSEPNLISLEDDEQIQIALVDPVQQKEGEEQPAARPKPIQEEMKVFTYQFGNLSAEQLVKAAECAVSLAADISVHETTQSLVIRATLENHKQIAKQLSALRGQHSPWESDQFRLVLARGKLATLMKEFGENHPKVKEAQSAIAVLEKSITEGSQKPRVVEEHEELLDSPLVTTAPEVKANDSEQSTAQTETSDLSNRPVSSSFEVGDLSAEELLAVGEYAMSVADLREVRPSSQCIMVYGTQGEVHKISKYIEELRNKRPAQVRDRFKPLEDRLKLAKQLKRFEENHPDIKQARDEIASMQKTIEEGTTNPQVVDGQKEMSDLPGTAHVVDVDQGSNEQRAVTHPLEGIDAEKLQDVVTFAESLPGTVSLDAVTHSLVVLDTPENQDKVAGYLTQLRESQETELKQKVEILAARKRVAAKVKEFGKDHPEVRKAQFEASNLERAIAEKSQGAQSADKFPITTTIFEADDEAIKQITDSDALGNMIPKKDAKKKFDSLTGKKKVAIIWEAGLLCRVGQPSRFFSGGESLLEPAPEDAIWVGQKPESVEFGDIGQVTVLDKKSRDGQRVLKYELEFTKRSYGNASKYEGTVLPLSFGQVFRGYAVVPDPKSEGVLIGPVGTVEKTSTEGGTRMVSTYLWIRPGVAWLLPEVGSK